MKTAVQELIERVEKYSFDQVTKDHVISLAEQLLEQEKKQIIDAYQTGKENESSGTLDEINTTPETYYDQTYK